jgi:hypothetical protein
MADWNANTFNPYKMQSAWPTYPTLPEYQSYYFDENPQAAFSYANQSFKKPTGQGFQGYLGKSFQDYYNKYIADLGLGNTSPETSWYDWYASKLGSGDVQKDFLKLSPTDRGERPATFQSRGRWVLT